MEQQNNSKVLVLSVLLAIVLTAVLVVGGMKYMQEKSELPETEESTDSDTSQSEDNNDNSVEVAQVTTPKPVNTVKETPQEPTKAEPKAPENTKKAPNVYTNARYGFSLELPPTWGEFNPTVETPEAKPVDPNSPFQAVNPIQTITFQSPEDATRKFVIEIFATDNYPDGFASRTKLYQDNKYTFSLSMSLRESDATAEIKGLIIPSFKKL